MAVKVTAIVSAYCGAYEFLQGRIENLLSQRPDPEVIVVCQRGSPEYVIVESFPRRPNLWLIDTGGIPTIYRAWNLAAEIASGEYITNANSDDWVYPGGFEALSDALDAHPDADVAYSFSDIIRDVGGLPVNRYEWIDGGLEELRERCFLGPMPMWRASLHREKGYRFDESLHVAGDYDFWLRVASGGGLFYRVKRATGAYLRRSDSRERREPLRALVETARVRSRWAEPEWPYYGPGGNIVKPTQSDIQEDRSQGGEAAYLSLPVARNVAADLQER